jgi:hypothetical protein
MTFEFESETIALSMRSMMRTDLFWWRELRTAAKYTGAN